jgi:hypothetical protein
MCKNNNRCFYDYNSTLSPEALVLTEAIPFINANREENERVSLDDLLQVLNSDIDNTITEISEPENILDDEPVEDPEDIIEEEQEEIIQVEESKDECDNDIKFNILMGILNRTYMPTEYKDDDIVILRELYKSSENDYVKQLLKEALLKLVYETIK